MMYGVCGPGAVTAGPHTYARMYVAPPTASVVGALHTGTLGPKTRMKGGRDVQSKRLNVMPAARVFDACLALDGSVTHMIRAGRLTAAVAAPAVRGLP